ncbi:MAG: S-layer homology domain-containing protein, partial [Clostridia bacterium]|nr:S-layer homology domain-containing protein [Clostridia bacterium]
YSSDEVRKEVLKYLAINDLDLSLSKQYDPQKKTYTDWETAYVGIDAFPYLLEYKDGEWLGTYSCEYDNESHVFYVKLNDDNKITFIDNKLPDDPQPPVIVKQFSDVNYKDWYGDAVKFATSAGLIKGYANGKFGTADNIQRQDFVVILARLSGDDLSKYEGKTSFKDVSKGAYYEAALAWAKEKKVSSGYANGKFGVGDKITREQIMTFFYNYAKIKGIDVTVSDAEKAEIRAKYTDFKNVSGYAQEATYWALSRGVISGKDAGNGKKLIAPKANALRCEVAAMFYNIEQKDIFKK